MYIDAYHDRKNDLIRVVERVNGERVYNDIPCNYVYYVESPNGPHTTIHEKKCKKVTCKTHQEFKRSILQTSMGIDKWGKPSKPKEIFESDINPVFRALADNYVGMPSPDMHVSFFDIEADFHPEKGFAPVTDPFNRITAISIYNRWQDTIFTVALNPPTISLDEARELVNDIPNTFVFDNEEDLLEAFLDIIEDTDLLCGYNSTTYDIPYTVNRIKRILGEKAANRLCLWNQRPRERTVVKFKREHQTYDLVGRVHIDFLELYQKHNTQQQHSYRLDFIGEMEVGENKVPYDGSLDKLYKEDFYKFILYNRQDTLLIHKINEKRKFIELSNELVHSNCVLFKTTLGSVRLVENAIWLEMRNMGLIGLDSKQTIDERLVIIDSVIDDNDSTEHQTDEDETDNDDGHRPVVGAFVMSPKTGLHEWVCSVDINSLYPTSIRCLNMSPETIFGQIRTVETDKIINEKMATLPAAKKTEAYDGYFNVLEFEHIHNKKDKQIIIDFEDGHSEERSAAEWHEYIFNSDKEICISANGTLFRTDKKGIIPIVLEKWAAERKYFQNLKKQYEEICSDGIEIDNELLQLLNLSEDI